MNSNGTPTWLTSEAGQQLQATLSQDDTLHALNRLLGRIDSLEQSVNRLSSMIEQGPGMVSMVTDMADEAIQSASQQGIDVESRLKNALQLAEKLTAPETVEKIEGLLATTNQLPGLVSMGTDMIDEGIRKAAENGVDVEERLQNALVIAEKLTAPEMVQQLDQLLQLAKVAPGHIAMLVDIVDEAMANGLAPQAATMLNPEVLATLGKAGASLTLAKSQPVVKRGPLGLLRALRDPDLQHAIGYLINFGKNFGQQLNTHS